MGHTEVSTYIQSGNVIFTPAKKRDPVRLAAELEQAISDGLGVSPRVVVLSRVDLADVIDATPYPDESNPKAVHAVFLATDSTPELREAVAGLTDRAAEAGSSDEATVVGRALYIHTPNGFGRSDLANEAGCARRPPRFDWHGAQLGDGDQSARSV